MQATAPPASSGRAAAAVPGQAARRSRARWLDVLATTGRAITLAADFEEAVRALVEGLASAFEFERVGYYGVVGDNDWINVVARGGLRDVGEPEVRRWPGNEGMIGRALRTRRTALANDVSLDPDYAVVYPETRSELCVPLVDGDRVLGLIDIQSDELNSFPPSAVEVVEAIAAQAVVVCGVDALRMRRERRLLEQRSLHALTLDLLDARPLDETLRHVAEMLTLVCRADSAGLYLADPDGALVLSSSHGIADVYLGQRLEPGAGLSGRVAMSRRTEMVRDYAAWSQRIPAFHEPWRCTAATPILHDNRLLGVIAIITLDPDRVFDDDDLRLLERMSVPAALAIHNARSVESHAAELRAVADLARALGAANDVASVRDVICEGTRVVTGAEAVVLLEPVGDHLLATAAAEPMAAGWTVPIAGDGPAQRAASAATAVTVSGRDAGAALPWDEPVPADARLLCQPVAREGAVIAVIAILARDLHHGTGARGRSLMAVVAGDAAAALTRAEIFGRLRDLGRRDGLTGLPNRRAWDEELEARLTRAASASGTLSVVMLDLDHFKTFNDTQGHQRGDLLLRECTALWREQLRADDLIARYGGEEFAVVLEGCGPGEISVIVERLRTATPAGQTCSAGVATWNGVETADALVARADAALYEAKIAGRDRAVTAEPLPVGVPGTTTGDLSPRWSSTARGGWTRWAAVLPRLLVEGAVEAVFQPVVRLDRVRWEGALAVTTVADVVGYEALARPVGADAGMSVEGLFAAAQYRGLAGELDWVCRQAALAGAHLLPSHSALFVNVSVSAMLDPGTGIEEMRALLKRGGHEPAQLILEITEREAVRDLPRFREVVEAHRACGFRIALDDVGEGHSTLELLACVRPDVVKLAARLVAAGGGRNRRAAVAAVTAFAADTGATVVAEGIETHADAMEMLEAGITVGQGWALGRPARGPITR